MLYAAKLFLHCAAYVGRVPTIVFCRTCDSSYIISSLYVRRLASWLREIWVGLSVLVQVQLVSEY